MEEQLARGDAQPINVISITGPPWFDEYTGRQLDEDEVMKAMGKEMASFKSFHVADDVPEEEATEAGIEVIPSRWLIHDRGGVKGIKARCVTQQINDGSLQDTFAATPSAVGQNGSSA